MHDNEDAEEEAEERRACNRQIHDKEEAEEERACNHQMLDKEEAEADTDADSDAEGEEFWVCASGGFDEGSGEAGAQRRRSRRCRPRFSSAKVHRDGEPGEAKNKSITGYELQTKKFGPVCVMVNRDILHQYRVRYRYLQYVMIHQDSACAHVCISTSSE